MADINQVISLGIGTPAGVPEFLTFGLQIGVFSYEDEDLSYDPIFAKLTIDGRLWTYQDVVDHLMDFIGRTTGAEDVRDARRAAQEALREVANAHRWCYYYRDFIVSTVAEYTTGTVAYDHAGGASGDNELTLTTGTWPEWARFGRVLISNVEYTVRKRVSDTIVLLDYEANPGADIAAGATFTIYRSQYPAPDLFVQMVSNLIDSANNRVVPHIHPREWMRDSRWTSTPSQPFGFTIMGGENYMSRVELAFAPPPNSARSYTGVYMRHAIPLTVQDYKTGTISVTAGSSTVSGVGTVFESNMIGSVIRRSGSITVPTGVYGSNPYKEERVVTDVGSGTSITVDSAFTSSASGVAYNISSPLDVDHQVMLNLYLRTAEKLIAANRRATDRGAVERAWDIEFMAAKSADNRYVGKRVAGIFSRAGFIDGILESSRLGTDME